MRPSRIPDAVSVEPADPLKRERLPRRDVHFTRQPNPIAQRPQIMGHTLHRGTTGRMVPRTAIPHRIQPCVKFRPTRLTNGLGQIRPIESEPLRGQPVEVRRVRVFPPVNGQLEIGAVIGHDDQKIRPIRRRRIRQRCRKKTRSERSGHGDEMSTHRCNFLKDVARLRETITSVTADPALPPPANRRRFASPAAKAAAKCASPPPAACSVWPCCWLLLPLRSPFEARHE